MMTTHSLSADRDPRWQAVVSRDRGADGTFYYSVKTTGVYCRPSCGARLPRPSNVRFHATAAEAEREHFRPCKRCKPNEAPIEQRHAAVITAACRAIEASASSPSLAALARRTGLSRHYFHRVFKSVTGLTPKAYAVAHRARRVRDELARASSVTEAIYQSGFNSSGRFYAASTEMLGMTPSEYRDGGPGAIRYATGTCSLGHVLVATSARGVCAILLGDERAGPIEDLRARFPRATFLDGDAAFEAIVARVLTLVEAPAVGLDLPLDVRGTAFQQRVWQTLRAVPAGSTASYSEIAARIGDAGSARAVARACGANPIAVAIPCHRVVKQDGSLSGYRWGVERKRALLARERPAHASATLRITDGTTR